jgi:hypothetical protein
MRKRRLSTPVTCLLVSTCEEKWEGFVYSDQPDLEHLQVEDSLIVRGVGLSNGFSA